MPTRHLPPTALAALLVCLGSTLPAFGQGTIQSGTTSHGAATGAGSSSTTAQPSKSSKATQAAGSETRKLSGEDRKFVENAALDGLAEVQLAQAAQSKASNEQVKAFARRMQEDHGKANDELKSLASSKGIQLPTELDRKHRSDHDKLARLSGEKFDREYMEMMVKEHRKDVGEFQEQARGGKDPDLKAFAAKNLPTLQEHLKMAQSTHDAVKGKGSSQKGGSAGSETAAPARSGQAVSR